MGGDLDEEIENAALAHINSVGAGRARISRLEGYVEKIVPSISSCEFKSHFRLTPETLTFEFVLSKIGDKLQRQTDGSPMIPAEKQLLMTLWRLETPDSFRSIHNRFNVGKATAVRAVRWCTQAIASLAPQFIMWPSGDRVQQIVDGFSRVGAFPGTIGAIDGTHIKIPAPRENPDAYVNRKGYHSIQVQVVCDHKLLFTNLCVGHVGSVHDARVLRLSVINDYLQYNSKFPNDSHLIGDSGQLWGHPY
ncbi:Putative nuclease, partial [Frankliniella fusca]